ncbi:MAG: hypothetical protein AB1632_02880 [Nitrospirota bacterium]
MEGFNQKEYQTVIPAALLHDVILFLNFESGILNLLVRWGRRDFDG